MNSEGTGASDALAEPTLVVRGLTAGYGDLAAVRDVSFSVAPGEVVALFGANGAGKSTTLKATVGALPRMAGEVRWLGRPTSAPLYRMVREGLDFVPEERTIVPGLTARDNLRLTPNGVAGALSQFPELEKVLDRKAGLLSGGEQQMLILGRALSRRPKALLVDELSLGLAPLVVSRLLAAIRHAADADGVAVLLVEQQARRALSVADRWYLMTNGVLTGEGTSADGVGTLEAAYLAGAVSGNAHRNEQGKG